MACPNVAGLAALVASINPNLTGKEIKKLILDNVQYREKYANFVSSSGLIDVEKTIKKTPAAAPAPTPCSATCKLLFLSNFEFVFKNLENPENENYYTVYTPGSNSNLELQNEPAKMGTNRSYMLCESKKVQTKIISQGLFEKKW